MQKALTNKTLEALKPQAKRYEVHDLLCPGMSVRVSVRGQKVFSVKFRYGLHQKRMKLGVFPRITLATAREKAMDILRQVDEGIDPTKRRRSTDMKVETVCREFIRLHAQARNKSWREAERILDREFVGTLGQRDIREIKRFDILEIMDAAVARGSSYRANRILSHVRKLFNWCIERGIVEASPIIGLKPPTKEISRERALDDAEVVRLLRACRNDVYPFRQFSPLLLATAQRRGELAEMRWSEINLDAKQWVIPSERSKNGKAHVVPLSAFALKMLDEVPRFLDCDYVFTTTRKSPVSGFSKALCRLSEGSQTSDWRWHDLRRTAASGMSITPCCLQTYARRSFKHGSLLDGNLLPYRINSQWKSTPETIARQLESYSDFLVLRALNTAEGVSNIRSLEAGELMGVTLDTETTGLDFQTDRIVELAIQRFIFDQSGRILEIEHPRSWLEDPGRPMPERVSRLTGIRDLDLVGCHFDDEEIATLIGGADIVIAHNAAFDRPFVDHRFPELRNLAWACSLSQIDWLELGFDGRALGHLLLQTGWFFQGHRATNDVSAVTALLKHDVEGQTILAHLLQRCEANNARIEAIGAPFDAKDILKARGYRWDVSKRFWWREVEEPELPHELEWLEAKIYRGKGQPTIRHISPRERFASDL